MIYLLLYVDNMLIACHYRRKIDLLKRILSSEFEIKNLRTAKRIPGMEVVTNKEKNIMFLTPQKYIKRVLYKF